jgi:hypothetical protein
MNDTAPITAADVRELAADWYSRWDAHAPAEEFKPLLATEGVQIQHGDTPLEGFAGFTTWYEAANNTFFDEVHTVKEVTLLSGTEPVNVRLVANWQASRWTPPAAKSERINADASHTWVVTRSPTTNRPVLLSYRLDSVQYAEGSAKL